MAVTDLTENAAAEFLAAHDLVVLGFWAPWCAPCRAFRPVLEAASARHPDVGFARIDSDREKDLRRAFGIEFLPTLVVVRESVLLLTQPGYLDSKGLDRAIDDARELDLEAVRGAERPTP